MQKYINKIQNNHMPREINMIWNKGLAELLESLKHLSLNINVKILYEIKKNIEYSQEAIHSVQ